MPSYVECSGKSLCTVQSPRLSVVCWGEPTRSSEMRCCRASFFPEHLRGSQWSKSCVESVSNAGIMSRFGKTDPHCYWHRDYDICGKGYKRRGQKRNEGALLDSGGCCPSPSLPGKVSLNPMPSDRVNASSESDTGTLQLRPRRV